MPSKFVHQFGDLSAIRYGDEEGKWDPKAPERVAAFILGFDVDSRTTGLNERAWDVVTPVKEFWTPEKNVADLEVSDQGSGTRIVVGLGDWVGRSKSGRLRAFTNNKEVRGSGVVSPGTAALSFEKELKLLINKHSKEQNSNTPDFILATYITSSLKLYEIAVTHRDRWNSNIIAKGGP